MEDWNLETGPIASESFPCDIDYDETDDVLVKSLSNESAYIGKKLSTDKRVPGRINRPEFYYFWKETLKAPDFVLQTLRDGYRLPLKDYPPGGIVCNNRLALNERAFCKAELTRLEALGCIKKVEKRLYLVLPISVVFSKKLRLVVDASRGLNPYLVDRKVKLENLDTAEATAEQFEFQTKQDLDSGNKTDNLNYFKN